MKKNVKTKEQINIFQRMLEDKRAIRQCIQTGGNLKELAKARGIKFATPYFPFGLYFQYRAGK